MGLTILRLIIIIITIIIIIINDGLLFIITK